MDDDSEEPFWDEPEPEWVRNYMKRWLEEGDKCAPRRGGAPDNGTIHDGDSEQLT